MISGCAGSSLWHRLFSSCGEWGCSPGAGCGLLPLRRMGSREACGPWQLWVPALECTLSGCDSRAQLLWGVWDPPGPGIEPMSPESAGGFFDTEPPGKPRDLCFNLLHAHDGVETEVSVQPFPSPRQFPQCSHYQSLTCLLRISLDTSKCQVQSHMSEQSLRKGRFHPSIHKLTSW